MQTRKTKANHIDTLISLVDEIAHKHHQEESSNTTATTSPTSSTILGPFWSAAAPFRPLGGSIIQDPAPGGQVALMHGRVTALASGAGVAGAVVDIWQASSNGKYDFQDPEGQSANNLRGKFRTDGEGRYHFYCLRPTAYSLPTDGGFGLFLIFSRPPKSLFPHPPFFLLHLIGLSMKKRLTHLDHRSRRYAP
jgi:catechol 1,2-dioxygenase